MFVLNGHATKGVQILQKYGLSPCESKAYFTLLVLGETNAGNLSRQSGVHQSKVYWVLEKLEDKKLVATTQKFPRKVVALPFEVYLSEYIIAKQEEIDRLRESRKQLRELLCKLQPVALKLDGEIQVFEPSCRRGLNSSIMWICMQTKLDSIRLWSMAYALRLNDYLVCYSCV